MNVNRTVKTFFILIFCISAIAVPSMVLLCHAQETGVKKTVTFDTLGEVRLLCNVHPDMLGYVIVLQNPYFDLTDPSGKFQIKNVPAGRYQLKVWDEKVEGGPQQVVVTAGKTTMVEFKGLKKR